MSKVGVPEGSAVCYKSSRFESVDSIRFVIHDEIERISKIEDVPQDVVEQIRRPNVALISVLRDTVTRKYVICAGTHIIWNDMAKPALKALQACLISQKIFDIRETLSKTVDHDDIAVVFGGDFNSEPDHMSVKLMKNGVLTDVDSKTLDTLSYIVEEKKAVPVKIRETSLITKYFAHRLKNPLTLSSSYFDVMGEEPVITCSNEAYRGCLDYIFYTASSLKVSSVAEIDASVCEIYRNGGPTEDFSSDHLPLISEFQFI